MKINNAELNFKSALSQVYRKFNLSNTDLVSHRRMLINALPLMGVKLVEYLMNCRDTQDYALSEIGDYLYSIDKQQGIVEISANQVLDFDGNTISNVPMQELCNRSLKEPYLVAQFYYLDANNRILLDVLVNNDSLGASADYTTRIKKGYHNYLDLAFSRGGIFRRKSSCVLRISDNKGAFTVPNTNVISKWHTMDLVSHESKYSNLEYSFHLGKLQCINGNHTFAIYIKDNKALVAVAEECKEEINNH